MDFPIWLVPAFLIVGAIYSAVGHGGASAYLGLLALAGVMSPRWVPFVLILNTVVAGTAWLRYSTAGHHSWRRLAPFVLASVPAAYLGGMLHFDKKVAALFLGIALFAAGVRFLIFTRGVPAPGATSSAALRWTLPIGAILGFLAGAVGIGGGIFLSPLLIVTGWADAKQTAATSAGFIVVNSLVGLAARLLHQGSWSEVFPGGAFLFNPAMWILFFSAVAGGQMGSWAGSLRLPRAMLVRVLGLVLMLASFRHVMQGFGI